MATVSAPSHSTRVKSAPGSAGSPDRHAKTQAKDWKPEKSYGVGARYRTPAGPLALDLAYAARDRKFRIAFSVTVAF